MCQINLVYLVNEVHPSGCGGGTSLINYVLSFHFKSVQAMRTVIQLVDVSNQSGLPSQRGASIRVWWGNISDLSAFRLASGDISQQPSSVPRGFGDDQSKCSYSRVSEVLFWLTMLLPKTLAVNKPLGHGSMIVFFRLLRFYNTFIVVSTLVGSLSLAVLTFNEFHPTTSGQARAAEGFLVSSASTSVISAMIATMLLFSI